MTDSWDDDTQAKIQATTDEIAAVEALLAAKLAEQIETGRQLNTLRRKKRRLQHKLQNLCPYDATLIPGRNP